MSNQVHDTIEVGDLSSEEAAVAMRDRIVTIINDMAERMESQQVKETSAKKSAVLGVQFAMAHVIMNRLLNIMVVS